MEKLKEEKKWTKYVWHIILIIIILVQLFFAMKFFEAGNEDLIIEFQWTWATLTIWLCLYLILKGITNKTKLSLSIVAVIEIVFDIINYIVRVVRGSTITASDIFAIQTALSVSKNIRPNFDTKFIIGVVFALTIVLTLIIFRKKFIEEKEKWSIRVIKIIIGVMALFGFSVAYSSHSLWDMNHNYRWKGTPIALIRMFYDLQVVPPENYDKKETNKLLEAYETSNNSGAKDNPNIIVIINESFCDYYNLYKEGYADPIEYFTNLSKSENVISGVMYTSTFGGETANVEYEFLTQNSLRVLPMGSYVFQQYITKPIKSSLVQILEDNGYKTSAIHPWEEYAYSRNKIYRFFGFDSIKFKNDIDSLEKNFNNEFYSDRSTYKELMKQINNKKDNEKIFEYVLTVQNHTGYWNTDPNQIKYSDDNTQNVYMQLLHESTDALKEVVEELKQKDEKYILLFFGDHQPSIGENGNIEERPIENYELPFLIWANYDIEEEYDIKTSTVFMQNYLLKAAGIEFTAMNNYMNELREYYPIITKKFYIDSEGNEYRNTDNTTKKHTKLQEYYRIDYYRIFDEE